MNLSNYPQCLTCLVALTGMIAGSIGTSAATAAGLGVTQKKQDITISRDGQAVMVYRSNDVPMKPYVQELRTPGGIQLLRDAPKDHLHHHGLMFAVAVDGVDFWSEVTNCGRQFGTAVEGVKSSAQGEESAASFTQTIEWLTNDGRKLLREQRTLELRQGKPLGATLLTWRTKMEPIGGKDSVKLTGSHYFGLGMRFVAAMDASGEFINSEGDLGPIVRGVERVSPPARWCAYTSKVDDKPVTVAMFDSAKNVRRTQFFTMRPFAYLSATLNLYREPLVIKAGQPLELCYGVALWDGHQKAEDIAKLYERWIK